MISIIFLTIIIGTITYGIASVTILDNQALKPGSVAPDFNLQTETGTMQSLSSLKGQKVAVVFYPKAGTSHCKKELCSLRDGFSKLKAEKITILGISYDSPKKNKEFKEKNNLPFLLLSDTKNEAGKLYGADRTLFGLTLPFLRRITILINEKGNVVKTLNDIDINNHADQLIEAFGETK